METHLLLNFLMVLVESAWCLFAPKFSSTRKATSKAALDLIETRIIPGVSSRIVCASVLQITTGFSAFKIQDGNCILLDGRNLLAPEPGEEIEMINFSDAFPAIHGEWASWSSLAHSCSANCGWGNISSPRECNNPPPQYNGVNCPRHTTDSQGSPCNQQKCLGSVLEFPGHYGTWGATEICPSAHGFVTSMKTRAQEDQGTSANDAGMTEVNLFCEDGSLLRSAHDSTGIMGETRSCPLGYNAAKVKMEPINYDDSGANCLQLWCLSDETWHQSECTHWGGLFLEKLWF